MLKKLHFLSRILTVAVIALATFLIASAPVQAQMCKVDGGACGGGGSRVGTSCTISPGAGAAPVSGKCVLLFAPDTCTCDTSAAGAPAQAGRCPDNASCGVPIGTKNSIVCNDQVNGKQVVCCGDGTAYDAASNSCQGVAAGAPGSTNNSNPFGKIEAPPGVAAFNAQDKAAGGSGIGLILFVSNMIKLFTIIAGVLVFFNFILAGYTYVTSPGDSSAQNKMRDQITYSVIGLVLIVAAYTITAALSLVIFGKADFILNPVITGPTP